MHQLHCLLDVYYEHIVKQERSAYTIYSAYLNLLLAQLCIDALAFKSRSAFNPHFSRLQHNVQICWQHFIVS